MNPAALREIGFYPIAGLSLLVLLAASGKSAQFPFSSWLPRAMEGPTPSSAIFYGALSVHAGVLLLIRTYPIWQVFDATRVIVGGLGVVSAVTATLMGRVQSNIKGQIGYASIAQIGLMLVELSLGLESLVLFHFIANAILRCYQLLVSPSVVSHLLRVQSSSPDGIRLSDWSFERRCIPRGLQTSVYAFALNEGYLEHIGRILTWFTLDRLRPVFLSWDPGGLGRLFVVAAIAVGGSLLLWINGPSQILEKAFTFGLMIASVTAIMERDFPQRVWTTIALASLMACFAVAATGTGTAKDVSVYLMGMVPSWLMGALSLHLLTRGRNMNLRWNHGLVRKYPVACLFFFLSVLGISGFPITPTFLGEDLLLHHAVGENLWLAVSVSVAFVVTGIAAMRLFTKVCLGPSEISAFP